MKASIHLHFLSSSKVNQRHLIQFFPHSLLHQANDLQQPPLPLQSSVSGRCASNTPIDAASVGSGDGEGGIKSNAPLSPYEEAMEAVSLLITKRSLADKSNKGDRFDLLFDYLKILDLEDEISKMKIIRVAGTKGKMHICEIHVAQLRLPHWIFHITCYEEDERWADCYN